MAPRQAAAPGAKAEEGPSFEQAMERLETIVQSAQDGASAVHRIKQFAYEQPSETCEQINLARLANKAVREMVHKRGVPLPDPINSREPPPGFRSII